MRKVKLDVADSSMNILTQIRLWQNISIFLFCSHLNCSRIGLARAVIWGLCPRLRLPRDIFGKRKIKSASFVSFDPPVFGAFCEKGDLDALLFRFGH